MDGGEQGLLRELGETVAAAPGVTAAIEDALRRLTAAGEAAITLWAYPGPLETAPRAVASAPPGPPPAPPEMALRQLRAGGRAVAIPAGAGAHAEFIVPVTALGRLQGALQARALRPNTRLIHAQAAWEAAAPTLGLLLHALALQASLTIDETTGLLNARALVEQIDRQIARARRTHRPFALLLTQIDGLDAAQADRAIAAATVLRESCRDDDLVGRYRPDQFVTVLPESDGPGARVAAGRLLGRLQQPLRLAGGEQVSLSASVGYALFPVDGVVAAELLANATTAMHEARRLGGNRAVAA